MPKMETLSPSARVLLYKDGTRVLYSYETPVACYVVFNGVGTWSKTGKFHSRTTSKHIAQFIPRGVVVATVDQDLINGIAEEC